MFDKTKKQNLYLFLTAIQIILFLHYLVQSFGPKPVNYFYNDCVTIFFNPEKRAELIGYIASVCVIGIFILTVIIAERLSCGKMCRLSSVFFNRIFSLQNIKGTLISLLVFVFIPFGILAIGIHPLIKFVIQTILLTAIIGAPIGLIRKLRKFLEKTGLKLSKKPKILNYILAGIIFIGFLQIFSLLYGTIFGNPKIINEFFTIPETTLLGDKAIDNTQYWNEHFHSPITNKTDIITDYDKNCITDKNIADNRVMQLYSREGFYYNRHTGKLCINTADMSSFAVLAEIENINRITAHNADELAKQKVHIPTDEEKYFLSLNKFETHWQILSRFMIHHNSFIYVPIMELSLGKNIEGINAQYGLGATQFFEKILSGLDSISLDSILKMSYLFYYVYFIMLGIALYIMTKSLAWTSFLFIAAVTAFNLRGYDFRILPPGDAAWRHLFDVTVMMLLYIYAKKDNLLFLASALLLSVVSVWLNPQIGLMILTASVISAVFFAIFEKRHIIYSFILSGAALASGLKLYTACSASNDLAEYYLDGVIGFRMPFKFMLVLFAVFIIGYLLIKNIMKRFPKEVYLHYIFIAVYVQELFVYVAWHFNPDGLLSRFYFYILLLLILKPYISNFPANKRRKTAVYAFSAVLGLYALSALYVNLSKYRYEKIFTTHKTYEWNMERAKITSTMNPEYFQNGVDLIKKYSDVAKGIYIVSEFDNILPFLSDKYSLMPFFDLKWYHITPKELNKSVSTLKDKRPEYIFVDTGYDRNLNNEIIDPDFPGYKYISEESVWRVQRLNLLYSVFSSVEQDYQLVEKGALISVYKRK
ncbi:MAG: hypothetical protein AB7F25_04105 [Deferribacterales bacterium]